MGESINILRKIHHSIILISITCIVFAMALNGEKKYDLAFPKLRQVADIDFVEYINYINGRINDEAESILKEITNAIESFNIAPFLNSCLKSWFQLHYMV